MWHIVKYTKYTAIIITIIIIGIILSFLEIITEIYTYLINIFNRRR